MYKTKGKKVESIAVSELRANLMKVLKIIEQGYSLNITSRGRVIAQLIPPEDSIKMAKEKLSKIRKTAKIHDVLSPINETWKADS